MRISLRTLSRKLGRLMKYEFDGKEPWVKTNFEIPEPGVQITSAHIEFALQKRRNNEISDKELNSWAKMLLLNLAFEIEEGPEHDKIVEWLENLGPIMSGQWPAILE